MTNKSPAMLDQHGLAIEGSAFTILGAELHNSSSSSLAAIDVAFARVSEIGANTVLAPVSWAQFEAEEGVFDPTLIDAMIAAAEREDVRLVPLWFGSWKNGMSSYTPAWVKRNPERFPRAHTSVAGAIEHLSPFAPENLRADATAFRALARHIGAVDQGGRVIMLQVENEVGLLGDSRDRSAVATTAWAAEMPIEAVAAISAAVDTPVHAEWIAHGSRASGTWSDVLGESTEADEAFMAWGYARYVDAVAAAAREVSTLPLFTNVWLDSAIEFDFPVDLADLGIAVAGGMQPGIYPSGGPVMRVASLWASWAPTLDFVGPDVYFGDFDEVFAGYKATFGHLCIPEMRTTAIGVSHMFRAVGEHRAIGVSPFGVDSIERGSEEESTLQDGYRLLRAAVDVIRRHPEATVRGFMLDAETPTATIELDGYRAVAGTQDPYGFKIPVYPAYGIVIETAPGELVIVGRGFVLTFEGHTDHKVGILSVTELDFDGEWSTVRELNGDQTGSGSHARLPARGEVAPSVFPIPTFDDSTAILKVRTYSY